MNEALKPYAKAIARELLGRADRGFTDGRHLRFDKISINLEKATYYDSIADIGGDMVDLVRRIKKLENGAAEAWIEEVKLAEDQRRKLRDNQDRPLPDIGGLPTFDLATEQAIIGGLILKPMVFADVGEILLQGDLTFWVHQTIFEEVEKLSGLEKPMSIKALVEACGGDDGGDLFPGFTLTEYIARIAADCPNRFEDVASDLARSLRQTTVLREEFDRNFLKEDAADDARAQAKFKVRRFEDVALSVTGNYLVRGIIPRTGLVVIWGPPKCGKSFWTYDLGMHVATGMQYRDRKTVQGPVIYLCLEGEAGYGQRVAAFKQTFLPNHTERVPMYDISTRIDLAKDHQTLIKDIAAQLVDERPVMIIVDTLNRSIGGSESSDEDMGAYLKGAKALSEAFECVVVIIHHSGINSERPRGHTSLTGAADAQIAVRRDAERNVVCRIEYMKDGKEGDQLISRLRQVIVGNETDGTPIPSCVIDPLGGKVGDAGYRPNGQERMFMQCLLEATAEHGEPVSATGLELPRSIEKVVEYKYVSTKMYEALLGEGEDDDKHAAAVRQAMSRCGKKLKNASVIGSHRPATKGGKQYVWWTNKPIVGMPSTQRKQFEHTYPAEPELPVDIADFK